jgi:uncharacterized protein (DUF302 family)
MPNEAASSSTAIFLPGWFMPASDSLRIVEGLTTIPSNFDPKETTDRLRAEIRSKGLTIFAQIDHSAGAAEAGLTLGPTNLIIFGNARGGTPLMQASQTAGIDLPLKALVWQDAAGKTWLSYNEPSWIVQRQGLGVRAEIVDNMTAALSAISRKAAGVA